MRRGPLMALNLLEMESEGVLLGLVIRRKCPLAVVGGNSTPARGRFSLLCEEGLGSHFASVATWAILKAGYPEVPHQSSIADFCTWSSLSP